MTKEGLIFAIAAVTMAVLVSRLPFILCVWIEKCHTNYGVCCADCKNGKRTERERRMKNILVAYQSLNDGGTVIGNLTFYTDKYPVRYSDLQKISEEIKRVNGFTGNVIILSVILLGEEE